MLRATTVLALLALGTAAAPKPHVVLVLVDDFGWNNVGYHRKRQQGDGQDVAEVNTPVLDNLVSAGIELNRHYTYNYCSPSRSSLQSGRLPVHVSVENTDPLSVNPNDPVSGFSGIPTKMTGLAEKLKEGGYRTHMTGKWDAGMATWEQTPMGRGYETFFGYYHHANDYYTERLSAGSTVHKDLCDQRGLNVVDLWDTDGPARSKNGTDWEEHLFTENSLAVINAHDTSKPENPLFLFHAFHIVHTPLQIPKEQEKRFSFLHNKHRRRYASLVEYMDTAVGKMVAALERKGMWDNTLLVLMSDNGGPIYGAPVSPTGASATYGAASNLPLRGGKTSDWEGGIRVNAFVSGGAVPLSMRGTVMDDYVHISDWYATLCDAAGVEPRDLKGESAELPPVDSISHWPIISGQVALGEGARKEIHVSRKTLIQGQYKLITGNDRAIFPLFPENYTTFDVHAVGYGPRAVLNVLERGRYCGDGCLFDIHADPNEDHELSEAKPEIVARMMARLQDLNKGNFNPDRGQPSALGCKVAMEKYGGFYGPFVDLSAPAHETAAKVEALQFSADELGFRATPDGMMQALLQS